jgi:penicillin-binding protein 1A
VFITRVEDGTKEVIFEAEPSSRRAIKPEIAAEANRILKGVITSGTARRANIGRPAAGKTGTSQKHRDVWFVGYTPQLVTAVWVGHPKEKTIYINGARAFGGTVAAPIWAQFMRAALAGEPAMDFKKASKPKYDFTKFKVIDSIPDTPTAPAAPAAPKVKQDDGGGTKPPAPKPPAPEPPAPEPPQPEEPDEAED